MEITDTRASGLEDDDNFFELIRQRAGLDSRAKAEELTRDVTLRVARQLDPSLAHAFLSALPKSLEDYVFPKLGLRPVESLSLRKLESEIELIWEVDLEHAARFAGAVGLSISDRLGAEHLESVVAALPDRLRALFPIRGKAA